jgi:hypothetical protein
MGADTGGPADRPRPRPAPARAGLAAQQLHLLPQPALRGGARGGIPRGKIDTLTAWCWPSFHSEAQQAALRYTEAFTRAADTDLDAAFPRFHDALAEHFTREEMLEIVAVVVNMNVWTRIKLAETAMPGPWDLIRRSPWTLLFVDLAGELWR